MLRVHCIPDPTTTYEALVVVDRDGVRLMTLSPDEAGERAKDMRLDERIRTGLSRVNKGVVEL